MPKFTKKPVEIEAVRIPLIGEMNELEDRLVVIRFMEDNGCTRLIGDENSPTNLRHPSQDINDPVIPDSGYWIEPATGDLMIRTLEGDMRADDGDWLIKGIKGEFYPCKPDIFEESYDYAGE